MKDQEGFSYPKLEPHNFAGLPDQSYEAAKVVVVPIPYDSTTYYMGGAKQGPGAIIEASRHMELYDLEQERDISKAGIFTLEPPEPSKNSPGETIDRIENIFSKIVADGKFPLMLGGEHSITLGPVRALAKKYKNLSVVHFDAHTDLRNEFEGTKYHHGCVMRRCIEECNVNVTHVGIRSVSEEEVDYLKGSGAKDNAVFFAERESSLDDIVKSLRDEVYITIDVDVLDSSLMPSTGTPEPGGLTWKQIIDIIRHIAKNRKVVGADVVELAPIPGMVAPDFLAAKLAYKILSYAI